MNKRHETVIDPRLPKGPPFTADWHWWWFSDIARRAQGKGPCWRWSSFFWLYTRTANAATLYVGPVYLIWRRPWLRGPAQTYYPQIFNAAE